MTPRNTPKVRVQTKPHLDGSLAGMRSKPHPISASPKWFAQTGEPFPPPPSARRQLGRLKRPWTGGSSGFEAHQGGVAGVKEREERGADFQSLGKPGSQETKSTRTPPRSPPRPAGPRGAEAETSRSPGSERKAAASAGRELRAARLGDTLLMGGSCAHQASKGTQHNPHCLRGGLIWRVQLERFMERRVAEKVSPKLGTYPRFPGDRPARERY